MSSGILVVPLQLDFLLSDPLLSPEEAVCLNGAVSAPNVEMLPILRCYLAEHRQAHHLLSLFPLLLKVPECKV